MPASINPFGGPWPLLNMPVMMGDLGSAYFNLDAEGRVHWSADCG